MGALNMMSAPTSSSVPSTSSSLTSPTDAWDQALPRSNVHQVPRDPPGHTASPPPLKYVTYEVYLLPREWTPSVPGTHCFPSYPEDMVPRQKPLQTSMRPNCHRRQDDANDEYNYYYDGRSPYVYRQQEAAQQTRILNRRRSASIAGVKRRSSCSVAVVGAAPVVPSCSTPEQHMVVAQNPDGDVVPPSVVIRELQPGDPEPVGSAMSLPPVDGDDTPVILATVEQPPSPPPPSLTPVVVESSSP